MPVARGLNAASPFGVEFDSFSDLISFGIAPGLLVYNWCFRVQKQADEVGVLSRSSMAYVLPGD